MITTKTLYQSSRTTPLGQIRLGGFINKSSSRIFESRRVFGRYALVYVLEGGGVYSDANRRDHRVEAGDLLLLFPDLAHSYGPQQGDTWSELFVVFDGPVFDLWRSIGLLSSEHPVLQLAPVETWLERLQTLLTAEDAAPSEAAQAVDVCRFLTLLTEILSVNRPAPAASGPPWLERARNLLSANLSEPLEPEAVAAEVGLSYETFRKQFQKTQGVAPVHYRSRKRIDAACSLLQHTQLSSKEISESLGFSDPFHFARRFKLTVGMTPKQFRRQAAAPSLPQPVHSTKSGI